MSEIKINTKYEFAGKIYNTYNEAEIAATEIDRDNTIVGIMRNNLWNLIYNIDTKYLSKEKCRDDNVYSFNIERTLENILSNFIYK